MTLFSTCSRVGLGVEIDVSGATSIAPRLADLYERIDVADNTARAHLMQRKQITHKMKQRLVARQGLTAPGSGVVFCFYCPTSTVAVWKNDGRVYLMGFEVDHLTPVIRGGEHTDANFVLSCQPCNLRKGTKTLKEFLAVA